MHTRRLIRTRPRRPCGGAGRAVGQWLAGVNRMARADALSATRAAATKRTAEDAFQTCR